MEPIAPIIGALAAGSAAATKDTASQPVKDGHAGFKSLIQKRFADKKKPESELT